MLSAVQRSVRPVAASSRSLASATRRSNHSLVSASTIYSPTPDAVRDHLSTSTADVALFLLTTSIPPASLSPILDTIRSACPNAVGSFSSSAPGAAPSLSIARFDSTARIWYDPQVGRPPAEVGRWQRPASQRPLMEEDKKGDRIGELRNELDGRRGWEHVWEPERAIAPIEELNGVDGAGTFLTLTAASPRPTLRSLDQMFPKAVKTGLISTPTPFLTGRPNTLFYNDRIYNSGTVGIALPYVPITYDMQSGLEPISTEMVVESSQGNMLLSLEGAPNPTQFLIQAIQKRPGGTGRGVNTTLGKDEDFYLALINPDSSREIVKLLSGDPSRGALSLEMEDSIRVGQVVQRPDTPTPASPSSRSLIFSALPRSDEEEAHPMGTPDIVDGFTAHSEGGFIHSGRRTSICSAPWGYTSLRI